ncbi:unnamed protein product [Lactuca virosa]|uniref:Uncharacterized protein n=1 Tax=Lactuca virosa TaxID=75947 RepID=A0AAU9NNQ3_9ASTR|nr:unnamed protein product [Lactuca virosa]
MVAVILGMVEYLMMWCDGRLQHPISFVSPKCRQKRIKDYRLVLAGAATSRKTRLASFIYSILYRGGEGEMDPPPAEHSRLNSTEAVKRHRQIPIRTQAPGDSEQLSIHHHRRPAPLNHFSFSPSQPLSTAFMNLLASPSNVP